MTSLLPIRLRRCSLLLGMLFLFMSIVGLSPVKTLAAVRLPVDLSSTSPSTQGRAHIVQNPTWVRQKLANQLHRSNVVTPAGFPAVDLLNLSYVSQMSEPPATGKDALGHSYTDWYFANFCDAGATDVAMDFWPKPNNRNFGQHLFTDPHNGPNGYPISTTWNDTNFRAYMMYLAEQVKLPGWSTPGEVTYYNYPSANTFPADLRDTMNWEASGHASNWSTFFYTWVSAYYNGAQNLTQAWLLNMVENDLYYSSVPPVVNVDDHYLPSWSSNQNAHTSHAVAIVGYDNTHGTYTYIETCTPTSCGTTRSGVFTVSQSALYTGIMSSYISDGGIVW